MTTKKPKAKKAKKQQYVTMYMHLIDNRPASFCQKWGGIFYEDTIVLEKNLRDIRRKRRIDRKNFPNVNLELAHCRVRVPVPIRKKK